MSAERIAEALGGLFGLPPMMAYPAIVKSVQGKTCTICPSDAPELEIDDVVLLASTEAENGLTITPKVGTTALVGLISNSPTTLYLIVCDEVEKIEFVTGETKVSADADGVTVERSGVSVKVGQKVQIKAGSANLKDLLSDIVGLFDTAMAQVTAPNTPAPFDPATKAKVAPLKAKISQLLE